MLIISCGRDRAPRVNSPLRERRRSSHSCELIRRRGSWDEETFFYCAWWFTRGRNLAIWWRCSFFIYFFIHLFVFIQDCHLSGPTQLYARSHISALSQVNGLQGETGLCMQKINPDISYCWVDLASSFQFCWNHYCMFQGLTPLTWTLEPF